MSYDFFIYDVGADPSAPTSPPEYFDEETGDPIIEPVTEQKLKLMRTVAARLQREYARLSVSESNMKSTEGEQNDSGPSIHANDMDDGFGMSFDILPASIEVNLPYLAQGAEAHRAIRQLIDCMKAIEDCTPYRTYDPQLDRVLDLNNDFDEVVATYAPIVERLHGAENSNKPWWRFW